MDLAMESATLRPRDGKASDGAPVRAATPYYRRMARKEARIRQEQFVALSRLVQVLARRRIVRGGPRLTENTLIRVAIDLLLERADRLAGDTEADLRASVLDRPSIPPARSGLALFDLRPSERPDDPALGG